MSKVVNMERCRMIEKFNGVTGVTLDNLISELIETAGVEYADHIVHDVIEGSLKEDDVFWGLIKDETVMVPDASILLKMYLLGVIHAKKGV